MDNPMTSNQQTQLRAGRFILAADSGDLVEITSILREAAGEPVGVLSLCTELAGVAAAFAARDVGDEWRSVLNHALLDLSLGPVGDVTEEGT